jgi:formylglycine-generating enzyme required for sulfatase activity
LAKVELKKITDTEKAESVREDARLAGEKKAQREAAEQAQWDKLEAERQAKENRPAKTFTDCADCPEMVVLPAGNFDMGGRGDDEKPVHRVTLRSFAMGKTEVTQGQWKSVMGNNPSRFSNCGDGCPVETVSWIDAHDFVRKLTQKVGKTYRLPSEAEWEYACRAGGKHAYCGSDDVDKVAWSGSTSNNITHPVADKNSNAWGLYDMSGNVYEWTDDCWNDSYRDAPVDGSARSDGDCKKRVVRSSGWYDNRDQARSASRIREDVSSYRSIFSGFRVVRVLESGTETTPNGVQSGKATADLKWADSAKGNIAWDDAKNYCTSMGSKWRLPSAAELLGLYQLGKALPCNTLSCEVASKYRFGGLFFWSNEWREHPLVWGVNMGWGAKLSVSSHNLNWALCVRGV